MKGRVLYNAILFVNTYFSVDDANIIFYDTHHLQNNNARQSNNEAYAFG